MSKDSKALAADAIKAGQDIGQQVSEVVKENASNVVDSVKTAATQAQQRAGEQLEEWSDDISEYAGERLQSLEAAVVEQIRQQPFRSVLIVAGFAFLLGAIWRHR
jgi:ElaB/YqjD/DUF883 family membrane-anchored ribosome-binding protein